MSQKAWRKGLEAGLIAVCALAATTAAAAPNRYAFVVGNAQYEHADLLRNARNDAADMGAVMRELGFTVVEVIDADLARFDSALAETVARVKPGETVVVYFAGHGVMGMAAPGAEAMDNFLVPVDARLEGPERVPQESLGLHRLLAALDKAGAGVRLLIFDACRNNPFAEDWPPAAGSRGAGLVQPSMSNLKGAYIAFATSPGEPAGENPRGRNGLFTQELLKRIRKPGISVNSLFEEVSAAVEKESRGGQVPFFVSGDAAAARLVLNPSGAAPGVFDPMTLDLRLQREAEECGLPVCLEAAAAQVRDPRIRDDLRKQARAARAASPGEGAPVVAAPEFDRTLFQPAVLRVLDVEKSKPNGWARVAERFMSGADGFPVDPSEAMRWWRAAAQAGSGAAAYALASAYHDGLPGVGKDRVEAYRWIVAAARGEYPAAFSFGGLYNLEGWGGRARNPAEAKKWFDAGSGREDPLSQLRLAQIYKTGLGDIAAQPVMAQAWFFAAARSGDPTAMLETGLTFYSTEMTSGFPRDRKEALGWFRKAYDAGVPRAAGYIGACYRDGDCGVAADPAEAMRWLRLAAEGGDEDSMLALAKAYEAGTLGLARSRADAELWYRRAAVAGSQAAQAVIAGIG